MTVKLSSHFSRRNVITLVVALLTLLLVVPRLSVFKDSLNTIRHADVGYAGLALVFWLSTFFAATLVYTSIAPKKIRYSSTFLVQLASGFTNRLAPLGAGVVTLNIRYLMKRGYSAVQAGSLVALNNLLGFIGIALLLLTAIILQPFSFQSSSNVHIHISAAWLAVMVLCVLAVLALVAKVGLSRLRMLKTTVIVVLQGVFHQPFKVTLALLAAMAITVGYTGALYCVGLAFNVHISIAQALLVLTLGVAAASITPTPGGVGGAEVGLVAALVAVGVSSQQALALALTYRFITYWLPILPGFIGFQVALRRRYI